jgi:hypothetical protein
LDTTALCSEMAMIAKGRPKETVPRISFSSPLSSSSPKSTETSSIWLKAVVIPSVRALLLRCWYFFTSD